MKEICFTGFINYDEFWIHKYEIIEDGIKPDKSKKSQNEAEGPKMIDFVNGQNDVLPYLLEEEDFDCEQYLNYEEDNKSTFKFYLPNKVNYKDYNPYQLYTYTIPYDQLNILIEKQCVKKGNNAGKYYYACNDKNFILEKGKIRTLFKYGNNGKIKGSFNHYMYYIMKRAKKNINILEPDIPLSKTWLDIDFSDASKIKSNNYAQEVVQQIYIIRHFYLYVYIYYQMFSSLLEYEEVNKLDKLTVVSIGCGAKPDYIGLQFALSKDDKRIDNKKYKYIGVDYSDWDAFNNQIAPNKRYDQYGKINGDALTYFDKKNRDFDVIVFPNSISELYDENKDSLLPKLASLIRKHRKSVFYVCITLRAQYGVDNNHFEEDERSIKIFTEAMTNGNEYCVYEICKEYCKEEVATERLKEYEIDEINYKMVDEFINDLNEKIKNKNDKVWAQCKTKKFVNYVILKFVLNDNKNK